MNQLDIKGSVEGLEDSIAGSAKVFGCTPAELAEQLFFLSMKYVVAKREYERSSTRGAVLKELQSMVDASDERIGLEAHSLGQEALDAVFGAFPNAGFKIAGDGDYADVYVPARLDLLMSAIQKMTAVRYRNQSSGLIRVESVGPQLGDFWSDDPDELRKMLRSAGEEAPDLLRSTIRSAHEVLTQTFQLGDGPGGRNQKVTAGFVAPPQWELMNNILDIVWPIEKGQLHSKKMEDVRNIIDQVLFFIYGPKPGEDGGSRKTKRGLITLGEDEDDNGSLSVRNYRFNKGWLSKILTYRHQIYTLKSALEFIEQRKSSLPAVSEPMSPYTAARLERIVHRACYPLEDWCFELERRLRDADYRAGNETLRRPTGRVFDIPNVPKMKRGFSTARITIRLIHAWANYEGKKAAPNKGKVKNKNTGKFETIKTPMAQSV